MVYNKLKCLCCFISISKRFGWGGGKGWGGARASIQGPLYPHLPVPCQGLHHLYVPEHACNRGRESINVVSTGTGSWVWSNEQLATAPNCGNVVHGGHIQQSFACPITHARVLFQKHNHALRGPAECVCEVCELLQSVDADVVQFPRESSVRGSRAGKGRRRIGHQALLKHGPGREEEVVNSIVG